MCAKARGRLLLSITCFKQVFQKDYQSSWSDWKHKIWATSEIWKTEKWSWIPSKHKRLYSFMLQLWENDKMEADIWLLLLILYLACVLVFRILYCKTFFIAYSWYGFWVFLQTDCIFIVQQLSTFCLDSSWRRGMEKAWLCRQASIALFECFSESNVALLADKTVISVFLKQTCLFHIWVCMYICVWVCV